MTSPYAIYPANIVTIAQLLRTKIQTAPGGTFTIAPQDVFYGDQDRIPRTPAVCIEPGDKTRTLTGAPNMTTNEFEVFILVYHDKVEDVQAIRQEVDVLAYEIEKYIHKDLQLKNGTSNPALIYGFVRANESGYTIKAGTLYRSARLIYFGMNKTSLAES
jgi:hypothetical protein